MALLVNAMLDTRPGPLTRTVGPAGVGSQRNPLHALEREPTVRCAGNTQHAMHPALDLWIAFTSTRYENMCDSGIR